MKYFVLIATILLIFGAIFVYVYRPINTTAKSTEGCRAPDESGCQSCQTISEDGTCNTSSSSTNSNWYNVSSVGCEEGLPTCAACTKRDEEELKWTIVEKDSRQCDCENIEIGVDACFSVGCQCTCSKYNKLIEQCPQFQS